jgi:hypothetical protein
MYWNMRRRELTFILVVPLHAMLGPVYRTLGSCELPGCAFRVVAHCVVYLRLLYVCVDERQTLEQ